MRNRVGGDIVKFQFEAHLEHQDEAINSVINIFKGIKTKNGVFSIRRNNQHSLLNINQGISNTILNDDWQRDIALENIKKIQEKNKLPISNTIENIPTFDIEMETGTGKTYVFLKTILELNQAYDFKKFLIIVPSLAIKEGIIKTLKITKEHFSMLYPSIKYQYCEYDGQSLQIVWNFANNNNVEIMITNIQSINKDINIFNKNNDYLSGDKPIDLIKNTRPIVIIDEPQSTASGKKSIDAIDKLNPLFILRYSATFKKRSNENLIYKLDSIEAYKRKLVKQIKVYGTEIKNNDAKGYIKLEKLDIKKQNAVIEIKCLTNKGIQVQSKTIKTEDNLFEVSNHLSEYENLKVENIDFNDKLIELSNGQKVYLNVDSSKYSKAIKEAQIRETIKEHLNKQVKVKNKNIKVLSLFFIDKVANYRQQNEQGEPIPGEYAKIFERNFQKIVLTGKKEGYWELFGLNENDEEKENIKKIEEISKEIHDGYFSIDKKNNYKDTKGDTKEDKSTYDKIMKDKEKLISFNGKLSFIFSHSALKEGWDNPNVFQICTLNETKSEIKQRQEIGRGLRLCVNQEGQRVYDENINQLSIFPNNRYEEFISNLQKEMVEDGIEFKKIDITYLMNQIPSLEYKTCEQVIKLLQDENIIKKDHSLNLQEYEHIKVKEILENNELDLSQESIENILDALEKTTNNITSIVKNGRKQKENNLKHDVVNSEEFQKLWNIISSKTTYCIKFDSTKFVEDVKKLIIEEIENKNIEKAKILITSANININRTGIEATNVKYKNNVNISSSFILDEPLTDIVSDIEKITKLTRKTIIKIISDKKIIESILENQDTTKNIIIEKMKKVKENLMVDGIEYQKNGESYHLSLLEDKFEFTLDDYSIDAKSSKKYPYEYIVIDKSKIEQKFGNEALNRNMVKTFIKLPKKFQIPTPLGFYNPDWALYDENNIVFVAETKGSTNENDLREKENKKIKCGKKHFKILGNNIKYEVVDNLDSLLKKSQGKEDE